MDELTVTERRTDDNGPTDSHDRKKFEVIRNQLFLIARSK